MGSDAPTTVNADTAGPIRLAVLVSGGGSTLANLVDRIADGALKAQIGLVIASNRKAADGVVRRHAGTNWPTELIDRCQFGSAATFSQAVFDRVRQLPIDLVCLAGFLSLLVIPEDFTNRVVNIHPALLPRFGGRRMYGPQVHEAVLAAGCKVSGCTVHFADRHYDTGPIILQRTCPVVAGDTPESLARRVFAEECIAYPAAINLIAAGCVRLEGRKVHVP